jgi:hypothetical protein
MNTLGILFQYSYIANLVTLNWHDVSFAIEQGFLSRKTASEHAAVELSENENPTQSVIDLAFLEKNESIHPYIGELSSNVPEHKRRETHNKFLYILLNWVYEHRYDYPDPLEIVEIIYADFNYPTEISDFVRYMPISQPVLGTLEENKDRLYANWKKFLDSQKTLFSRLP